MQSLGYDVSCREAEYYLDLVEEVCQIVDCKSEEEIKEFIPCCYIEYGHFIYEGVGVKKFKESVHSFYSSYDPLMQDSALRAAIYGEEKTPSVEDSILLIAKYANQVNRVQKIKVMC